MRGDAGFKTERMDAIRVDARVREGATVCDFLVVKCRVKNDSSPPGPVPGSGSLYARYRHRRIDAGV